MWVGANPTEVLVTAQNSANAMQVARKLYPMAKIVASKEV